MAFLRRSAGINATYYKTNTHNQFFKLPALSGEAYAYRYENAGNIENQGVEVSLSAYPGLRQRSDVAVGRELRA